jgi:hypothetical protein
LVEPESFVQMANLESFVQWQIQGYMLSTLYLIATSLWEVVEAEVVEAEKMDPKQEPWQHSIL